MVEPKVPKGFEVQKYPNVQTREDVDMYVCTKCEPAWDTFSIEEAANHAALDVHRPTWRPEHES